jgi:hypothetical protein
MTRTFLFSSLITWAGSGQSELVTDAYSGQPVVDRLQASGAPDKGQRALVVSSPTKHRTG